MGPSIKPMDWMEYMLDAVDNGRFARPVGDIQDALHPKNVLSRAAHQDVQESGKVCSVNWAIERDAERFDVIIVAIDVVMMMPVVMVVVTMMVIVTMMMMVMVMIMAVVMMMVPMVLIGVGLRFQPLGDIR